MEFRPWMFILYHKIKSFAIDLMVRFVVEDITTVVLISSHRTKCLELQVPGNGYQACFRNIHIEFLFHKVLSWLLSVARLGALFKAPDFLFFRTGTHHAETKEVVQVRRAVVATASNTTVRSEVAPAPTAIDVERPRRRTVRICLRR